MWWSLSCLPSKFLILFAFTCLWVYSTCIHLLYPWIHLLYVGNIFCIFFAHLHGSSLHDFIFTFILSTNVLLLLYVHMWWIFQAYLHVSPLHYCTFICGFNSALVYAFFPHNSLLPFWEHVSDLLTTFSHFQYVHLLFMCTHIFSIFAIGGHHMLFRVISNPGCCTWGGWAVMPFTSQHWSALIPIFWHFTFFHYACALYFMPCCLGLTSVFPSLTSTTQSLFAVWCCRHVLLYGVPPIQHLESLSLCLHTLRMCGPAVRGWRKFLQEVLPLTSVT